MSLNQRNKSLNQINMSLKQSNNQNYYRKEFLVPQFDYRDIICIVCPYILKLKYKRKKRKNYYAEIIKYNSLDFYM